ncbi:hypothetical protein C4D60_Mb05t06190 [Musa balbisiana]|uniref:Uncharacterized protein n=1 Tax=Musa balbisiana TaxID=52838 RepID=A0A4S8JU44_MUSBA|nr:hypothetical protein C4D60_Mb05t06190 [Musa balbisiana]
MVNTTAIPLRSLQTPLRKEPVLATVLSLGDGARTGPRHRDSGAATTSTLRQDGQLEWEWSHASTHPTTRSSSPSSNSARQIGHSTSPPPPAPYEIVGSARKASFSRPLLDGSTGERRRQAQRATRASPVTETTAQRSAAMTTTTSVSMGTDSDGGNDGNCSDSVRRNLAAEGIDKQRDACERKLCSELHFAL